MKKTSLAVVLAAALGASALPALAAGFGNQRSMSVDGKNLLVSDTSARLLGNDDASAPLLVDDITDGQAAQKVPGYKLMLMNRTYSLAAEMRPPREGAANPVWREQMYLHRGVKLIVGIPVVNGQMDLAGARLLEMGVVSDEKTGAGFKPEDNKGKLRPSGEQLVTEKTTITQPKVHITELTFPDLKSGEASGGGVKLEAEATLDGKRVHTSANSTFARFQVAHARAAKAFKTDPRFLK